MLTGCKKCTLKNIHTSGNRFQNIRVFLYVNSQICYQNEQTNKKPQKYPPRKYSNTALHISLFPRINPAAPQLMEFHQLIEKPDVC